MIRNFLYNKALIVISLSFSLLIGQTEVSTSVFWYKDQFDALPQNVQDVLKPELDQMTTDFTEFAKKIILYTTSEDRYAPYKGDLDYYEYRTGEAGVSHSQIGYTGSYTSRTMTPSRPPQSPHDSWIALVKGVKKTNFENQQYIPLPMKKIETKTTTWEEFREYHGGYMAVAEKGLSEEDVDKFLDIGRFITGFTITGPNTFKATATYRTRSYMNSGKRGDHTRKVPEDVCSYYNISDICGETTITGTYDFPEFDFTDIYKLGRKNLKTRHDPYDRRQTAGYFQKEDYRFPFDEKNLENFNITFKFDHTSFGSFDFNMAYLSGGYFQIAYLYAESARQMATDLKRKDSWISRQIKK